MPHTLSLCAAGADPRRPTPVLRRAGAKSLYVGGRTDNAGVSFWPTLRCLRRSETRSSEIICVGDTTYMQVQVAHRRHGVKAAADAPLESIRNARLSVLRCVIVRYDSLLHARPDMCHYLRQRRARTRRSIAAIRPSTACACRPARSERIDSISCGGTVTFFFLPDGDSSVMTKGIRGRMRK